MNLPKLFALSLFLTFFVDASTRSQGGSKKKQHSKKPHENTLKESIFSTVSSGTILNKARILLNGKRHLAEPEYPTGTPTYKEFEEGWYEGEITGYKDGTYTVTWSDDTDNHYDDLSKVKDMVEKAANMPEVYAVGTPVFGKFGDGWFYGKIIEFDRGTYLVQFSDGRVFPYASFKQVREMVEQAGDYTYAIGTLTYYEFEDGWYEGAIVKYKDGTYTVRWEDETEDDYDVYSLVKTMVEQAAERDREEFDADKPTENIGLPVFKNFVHGWFEGKITDYIDETYIVKYSDGNIEEYPCSASEVPCPMVQELVQQAKAPPRSYENGTPVYYAFTDQWYAGEISQNFGGTYIVTWGDDEDTVHEDFAEVTQMVEQARAGFDDQLYDIGTITYYRFDDGWFYGEITDFRNGKYTVMWSDGEEDNYYGNKEVTIMVHQAMIQDSLIAKGQDFSLNIDAAPSADNGNGASRGGRLGAGGIFGVLLVVIGFISAVGFVVLKKRKRANEGSYGGIVLESSKGNVV